MLLIPILRTAIEPSAASPGGPITEKARMPNLVRLEVQPLPSVAGGVHFKYVAHNDSGKEVYLFNVLFTTDVTGHRKIDRGKVYRMVEGRLLHLSKTLVRVPENLEVEMPEVPYLTPLPPGKSFAEEITVEAPIREQYPYAHPQTETAKGEVRICEGFTFSLGYFVPLTPDSVRKIQVGLEKVWATDYGFATQGLAVVSSKVLSVTAGISLPDSMRRR
jgi:hypothetical protein